MALAVANAEIRLGGGEIGQPVAGVQDQLDLRVAGPEIPQAAQQPAMGEDRLDRHHQAMGRRALGLDGCRQPVQQGAEGGAQAAARRGQAHAPGMALEQGLAQPDFEIADMAADGGLGDMEFRRRPGKGFMAEGRLEGAHGIQRRQDAGHAFEAKFL